MNAGKTLFAQVMEFVPWTSFARIVHRYSGNAGARTLSCARFEQATGYGPGATTDISTLWLGGAASAGQTTRQLVATAT